MGVVVYYPVSAGRFNANRRTTGNAPCGGHWRLAIKNLISSVNVRRNSERGNVFGNWACVTNPTTGETRWGYFTAGENRLPVRQTSWRCLTADLFTGNWSLVTSHPDVLADVHGGSRPPRSVRSAIAEQARKRRYNAARKAAREAERAVTDPTLFG